MSFFRASRFGTTSTAATSYLRTTSSTVSSFLILLHPLPAALARRQLLDLLGHSFNLNLFVLIFVLTFHLMVFLIFVPLGKNICTLTQALLVNITLSTYLTTAELSYMRLPFIFTLTSSLLTSDFFILELYEPKLYISSSQRRDDAPTAHRG